MFERMTDRSRRAVVLAQEEAMALNHDHIRTEHLLLGLIREGEGVAAKALQALGISLETVRQQVEDATVRGEKPASGHIPFTPQAKTALELSLRESRQLGHSYIGTEHMLLGLIREGEGVAAQVLVRLGADASRVRQEVLQLLHGYLSSHPAPTSLRAGRWRREQLPRLLAQFQSMESRVSALERHIGTAPDGPKLDRQIAEARQAKEEAIDSGDFEAAAVRRDRERQLVGEKQVSQAEWRLSHPDARSLTEEVERLRELLRQHGIDPDSPQGSAA